MSKESFKMFVRGNPNLVNYVNSGQMTWQKFYEMHDVYGENHSIWNSYLEGNANSNTRSSTVNTESSTVGDTSVKDLFNMIKKVDLETVRKGVDGLQKAVGLVQDLTTTKRTNNYQARPLYKHLED